MKETTFHFRILWLTSRMVYFYNFLSIASLIQLILLIK